MTVCLTDRAGTATTSSCLAYYLLKTPEVTRFLGEFNISVVNLLCNVSSAIVLSPVSMQQPEDGRSHTKGESGADVYWGKFFFPVQVPEGNFDVLFSRCPFFFLYFPPSLFCSLLTFFFFSLVFPFSLFSFSFSSLFPCFCLQVIRPNSI